KDAGGPQAPDINGLLVAAEERELGADRHLLLARLACDVLGQLGIRDGAIAPLGRYLFAEGDQNRAALAGIALALLGGAEAERLVVSGIGRYGNGGPYWIQVSRVLARAPKEPELLADTPAGHVARGFVRRARSDLAGAIADYDRAIELDPRCAEAVVNRAAARS